MAFTLRAAQGKDFIDRKGIVDELVKAFSKPNPKIGFAIYGRRRVGKTSIIVETKRRLAKNKYNIIVYYSLQEGVESTTVELSKQLSIAIIDAYAPRLGLIVKAEELLKTSMGVVKEILSHMKVSLKTQTEIETIIQYDPGKSSKETTAELVKKPFDLAETLAKETKTTCIIFLDEFPEIMRLKNGSKVGDRILGAIRASTELKQQTVLNISGSAVSTMETIVLDRASPFYNQLKIIKIPLMEDQYIKKIITRNIKKISPTALEKIVEFCHGLPYYAHFLGRELRGKKTITGETVKDAIAEFFSQEGNALFLKDFNHLSPKERSIVMAMAQGEDTLTKISRRIEEPTGAINRFIGYLERKLVVEKINDKYILSDPIFAEWIRRTKNS